MKRTLRHQIVVVAGRSDGKKDVKAKKKKVVSFGHNSLDNHLFSVYLKGI